MAKNLRLKLPASEVLIVQDINNSACNKFVAELAGYNVVAVENAREVAEKAVRGSNPFCAVLPDDTLSYL